MTENDFQRTQLNYYFLFALHVWFLSTAMPFTASDTIFATVIFSWVRMKCMKYMEIQFFSTLQMYRQ
jgi:hypothetical protein